jgi:hypothetical protein
LRWIKGGREVPLPLAFLRCEGPLSPFAVEEIVDFAGQRAADAGNRFKTNKDLTAQYLAVKGMIPLS